MTMTTTADITKGATSSWYSNRVETTELVVVFPEDTSLYTEIACLLPGHYEAGMKGDIEYSDS